MTIQTIIFDFGGVLYKTPSLASMNRWKRFISLEDHPEIAEMLDNPNDSQLVKDICLGKISEDEIWSTMAEKWHLSPAFLKGLRERFFARRKLNKPMFKLLGELKKDYQTAILSNAGDQSRRLMEDVYHLDQVAEEIIISAEEGVIKPDRRLYEIAVERLETEPQQCVFLDDLEENVIAARAFGMHAVQFTDNVQARSEIMHILEGKT